MILCMAEIIGRQGGKAASLSRTRKAARGMNPTERFYKIDQMLHDRGVVSFQTLMDELEVSRATLKRDLAYLRDRRNAPNIHDREAGGLLGPHIKPLLLRLTALIGVADNPAEEVVKRIRILTVGARQLHLDHFQVIGSALLRRKRLIIRYHARGTDTVTEREISPQRLIHYRDNWYLDAWCHLREELRSFAVDAIQCVELLESKTKDVAEKHLNEVLGSGYGIFAGKDVKLATLRFSLKRARWVAAEKWHPKQEGRMLDDGSYELKVPYSNDPELLMDILRYGADCEVAGPEGLREKVVGLLKAAVGRYGDE